jgi:diguanylate cyclase (GGDEF)-like protein
MEESIAPRRPRTSLALLLVGLAALVTTIAVQARVFSLAPQSLWGLLVVILLVAVAALYRPSSSCGLALGAVGFPILAVVYGPVAAGAGGLSAFAVALVGSRLMGGRRLGSFAGRWPEIASAGGSQLLAGLGAGWVWWLLLDPPIVAVDRGFYSSGSVATASYLMLLFGLDFLATPQVEQRWEVRRALSRLAFEAPAVAAGILVGAAAVALGRSVGWGLLAGVALISLELSRGDRRRRRAEARAHRLRQVQLAGHRIIFGESDLLSIARQIHVECRQVVDFSWFHFQLAAEDGWREGWWAGPDGAVREGPPEPPASPAALPGIHRRASWMLMERILASGERTVGRLRLWCDPRQVEDDATEWLDALLPEMTSSILGALLDLEARQDPLTGLPDRRALEERLVVAFRQSQTEGVPTAVIMCDLDRFKKINDKHGHAIGDQALNAMAELLEAHRREGDLCCRYGGEEFAVVLEKTDGSTALIVAERLRVAVERHLFVVNGKKIPLRLSAGIAAHPELHVKKPQELLELADEALYEAKRQGRNRCLLNLGRGEFQEVDGTLVGPESPPPEIETPTLFA